MRYYVVMGELFTKQDEILNSSKLRAFADNK